MTGRLRIYTAIHTKAEIKKIVTHVFLLGGADA